MIARTAGTLIAAVALALLTVTPAEATFPGKNGKLVFAGCAEGGGTANCGLFVVNPDGSGRTQLTYQTRTICTRFGCGYYSGDNEARWSADGLMLVFQRDGDIYTANADGSAATQLTATADQTERSPAWSPDGRRIVFARSPSTPAAAGTVEDLLVMAADGSNATRIQEWGADPDWSPGGTEIAYGLRHTTEGGYFPIWLDLRAISPDGTSDRVLASTHEGQAPLLDHHFPSWSPDGRRIVIQRAVKSAPCCRYDYDLVVMNADGSGAANLTAPSTDDEEQPVYSPDGTKIAFQVPNRVIWVMNSDGSGTTQVTPTFAGNGGQADWQPIPAPRRDDYKNGAHFCKAEREFLGDAAFRQRYGGRANAFGRCVKAHH
jgi:TolB protein